MEFPKMYRIRSVSNVVSAETGKPFGEHMLTGKGMLLGAELDTLQAKSIETAHDLLKNGDQPGSFVFRYTVFLNPQTLELVTDLVIMSSGNEDEALAYATELLDVAIKGVGDIPE